jgi:hypothetical protein
MIDTYSWLSITTFSCIFAYRYDKQILTLKTYKNGNLKRKNIKNSKRN